MNLKVGTLVEVDHKFSPNNYIGVVYEVYDDKSIFGASGVSIILEDGTDLGGFSLSEQLEYLTKIRDTDFQYQFTNIVRLCFDIQDGVFKQAFKQKI